MYSSKKAETIYEEQNNEVSNEDVQIFQLYKSTP